LYNPSSENISIEGWTLNDNYDSFELTGSIASGGYFIIARDNTAFKNLYGFTPDISDSDLALGNSGDLLSLKDASGTEVDMVAWENEVEGWDISAVDTTIRRISYTDTDTVDDWENSYTIGDPESSAYVPPPPDDVNPIVSIDHPLNGSTVSGTVKIQISATDINSIISYELLIDGELKSTSSSFNWNTLNALDGDHSILAKAQDNSNNWGEAEINVIVDNSDYVPIDIPAIKFMTYNIKESGANSDWIEVVKAENPDIIVYVETGTWDDSDNSIFNEHLSDLNSYFSDEISYVGNTGQNIGFSTSGEAIMSRFPILSTTQLSNVKLDDGTTYYVSHDFMIWEIEVSGESLYVIGAHLKCCGGSDNEVKREKAQEGIINYMDSLGDVPIVYAGDLNSFSPFDTGSLAPEGDLASGPLTMMLDPEDPTYGSFSSTLHNFVDVYRDLNPDSAGYTYGHQNTNLESRIDFIIANQYFIGDIINSTTGDVGPASTGSDHYSVDAFLKLDYFTSTDGIDTTDSNSDTVDNNSLVSSDQTSSESDTTGPIYMIAIFSLVTSIVTVKLRKKN
jgi:endonuclease/exonuclease/phosphatase family metal-dependent hydrolase